MSSCERSPPQLTTPGISDGRRGTRRPQTSNRTLTQPCESGQQRSHRPYRRGVGSSLHGRLDMRVSRARSVRVRAIGGRVLLGAALTSAVVMVILVPAAEAGQAKRAPAGMRLLYGSDWSGRGQIYAVDPAGRLPTRQLTFGGCCGHGLQSVSPDGKRIVFSGCTDGVTALFVANADGRSMRRLARVSKDCYSAGIVAAWSPDAGQLAYAIGGSLPPATAS